MTQRILFTNGGRRNYIIEEALKTIEEGRLDCLVYVSDCVQTSSAMMCVDASCRILTPPVNQDSQEYIFSLVKICQEKSIQTIIPITDRDLELLATSRSIFSNIGVTVLVSNETFISTCMDKTSYTSFFGNSSLNTPKNYSWEKLANLEPDLRLIMKPRFGSGSQGIKKTTVKDAINSKYNHNILLQEEIIGEEYGVDIFNDIEGNFVHQNFRKKLRMRSGETDAVETKPNFMLSDQFNFIPLNSKHVSNLDIDFILTKKNEIYIIDMNPRFGGGYAFSSKIGFKYLSWLILMITERDYVIPNNSNSEILSKGISVHRA